MENQLNYRSFNNYRLSNKDIESIKQYVLRGIIPVEMNTYAKRNNFATRHEHFVVNRGKLLYERGSISLEVVKKGDRVTALQKLYNNKAVGMGHGIQQFYKIVASKYLNITRKEVEDFLKAQIPYQLTRKYVQAKNPTKKFTRENIAWSIDLIDMLQYERHNRHFKYIYIDIRSNNVYNPHTTTLPIISYQQQTQ